MSKKTLIFDIWGEFGHFKKFYTTSSPLTFSIPPPTAIYGILGAILGLSKNDYLKHINGRNTKVAIQILKPIKKTRMTLNLIDTKNSGSFNLIKSRTQIKTEFLKQPAYRLFINIDNDDLFNQLIEKVQNKECYYTVSLGLANLLANFSFINVANAEPLSISNKVDTAILSENIEEIEIKEGKKYFKEKLPTDMNINREPLAYKDVVMELVGNILEGKFKNCYKVGDSIISFL
ncbi:type I-B CRISPR-associated protein Cas5b [Venenivibrio stagnispumantis]|uniref:CRISPR-associated protein Cas5h n=1 Tax=Venenivibrio stagnispumantis TaxID=407998 RepID=A0AA45WJT7_9AQUI|nr:type I-B CRISPR-associated protein Cas5b [Venenivibrio stagnispumantis]MCW4572902.1 type I-B CRISPR-associated protein Cas5b [Venenivibrio stagnispumantis]SMP04151.1 CRISPR-associated protein Cas5h [Venenivibrio stagnispumantis]